MGRTLIIAAFLGLGGFALGWMIRTPARPAPTAVAKTPPKDPELDKLREELLSWQSRYRRLLAETTALRKPAEKVVVAVDPPKEPPPKRRRPRKGELGALVETPDAGDDEPSRDPYRFLRYMPLRKYRPYRRYRAYLEGARDRFGSKKDCEEHPFDELCLGTEVSCDRDTNAPQCFGTPVYCRKFPHMEYCVGTEAWCRENSMDSRCQGTPIWCSRNMKHPSCAGSREFCDFRPKDSMCLGTMAHCKVVWNQYLCVPDP